MSSLRFLFLSESEGKTMIPILVDCEDRSFYSDALYELTGKPRSYWQPFSIRLLKKIYRREIERKERERLCLTQMNRSFSF